MIWDDEASALYECFHHGAGYSVAQQEHRQENIEEYIDRVDSERDLLPEIQRFFDITTRELCNYHDADFDMCGCDEARRVEVEIYVPDQDRILTEWVERVQDRGIFREFQAEYMDDERWDIRARYGETELWFRAFFDENDLERYNFEPHSFEFGVSFPEARIIREKDYVYSWFEFLEDDFEERFSSHLQRYRDAISADFTEFDNVVDFRARIRRSLRDYLQAAGFDIRREVGDACPEVQRYGIDAGDGDFVALNQQSKIVVCHCGKSSGWHVHHFQNGVVESAENLPLVDDMLSKIESKIETYEAISGNKQTVSKFVGALAALFSLSTVILLFNNLEFIANFLNQQLPEFDIGLAAMILLLIDAVAAIVLVIIVARPFVQDMRFSWELDPYESGEDDSGRRLLSRITDRI